MFRYCGHILACYLGRSGTARTLLPLSFWVFPVRAIFFPLVLQNNYQHSDYDLFSSIFLSVKPFFMLPLATRDIYLGGGVYFICCISLSYPVYNEWCFGYFSPFFQLVIFQVLATSPARGVGGHDRLFLLSSFHFCRFLFRFVLFFVFPLILSFLYFIKFVCRACRIYLLLLLLLIFSH